MSTLTRRLGVWLSKSLFCAALVAPAGAVLAAEPVSVICELGTSTRTFSPAATMTPRDIDVTTSSAFSNCLTVLGQVVLNGNVTTGPYERTGLTCSNPLATGAGEATITWNTGEFSRFDYTSVDVSVAGLTTVVTYAGTVLHGKYYGATATWTIAYTTALLNLACMNPAGVSSLGGVAQLTITRVL
ncbi:MULTISPECIES: hypothetical protein [unclassified Myxococcus]|jgi:hypothetical protein|uniref:hypothetical protein n=1 Tax=Myxococcus TaxID=32 RepID=UPI001CBF141A|nr:MULTISPECIES: hypothetical protein [unclassified Myxococcus]MBZ4398710.1 hypothetical protein [Myxococcus sp. AS-1-15]MBZ4406970.1 hypothetical protein [Myxococcus sp. XM-1-1-1]